MPKGGPGSTTAIDIQIGKRIRLRRVQLGMSQTEFGKRIGVAFQQVQKYEAGSNRVAAGRLPLIADALEVPIGFFYGLEDSTAGVDTAAVADSIGLLGERHATELLTCFHAMTASQRTAYLEFGRLIAAANNAISEIKGAMPNPHRTRMGSPRGAPIPARRARP